MSSHPLKRGAKVLDMQAGVDAAVVTATETTLSAVTGDSLTTKTGNGRPALLGVARGSTDLQYVIIESNTLGKQRIYLDGGDDMGSLDAFFKFLVSMDFPENEVITLKVYQDSGGNQDVMICLLWSYPSPKRNSRKSSYNRIITAYGAFSVNLTANVWSSTTFAWTDTVDSTKKYDILAAYAYSADLVACRLIHTDFMGFKPGFPGFEDVGESQWFEFPRGDVPSFNGSNGLPTVEGMTGAAGQPKVFLLLGEY